MIQRIILLFCASNAYEMSDATATLMAKTSFPATCIIYAHKPMGVMHLRLPKRSTVDLLLPVRNVIYVCSAKLLMTTEIIYLIYPSSKMMVPVANVKFNTKATALNYITRVSILPRM